MPSNIHPNDKAGLIARKSKETLARLNEFVERHDNHWTPAIGEAYWWIEVVRGDDDVDLVARYEPHGYCGRGDAANVERYKNAYKTKDDADEMIDLFLLSEGGV